MEAEVEEEEELEVVEVVEVVEVHDHLDVLDDVDFLFVSRGERGISTIVIGGFHAEILCQPCFGRTSILKRSVVPWSSVFTAVRKTHFLPSGENLGSHAD